ncbi:hypothetical protein SE951_23785 [Escherichia coli]|nr:hypothetical protein [Escherichia coli]MDW9218227.1 hypothetical protein [Escherichia coli]MDW9218234.1 hypothetical protein [Escherichia coli]
MTVFTKMKIHRVDRKTQRRNFKLYIKPVVIYTVVLIVVLNVKEEIKMSGIENSNQGPGWHDHNTPYGTIHSYDGDSHSGYGAHSGGNGEIAMKVFLIRHILVYHLPETIMATI